MEESLLRTNFIGRDGFVWWIGQIPPVESWIEQANGEGWGNRYKVRIMGYHPYNTTELADEDLPWAGVILPPGNTGSAGVSKSCKFQPGDTVIGFFLDGENAQQPMIWGCFGNSRYAAKDGEKRPFGDFTGFTDQIQRPSAGVVSADESNDSSVESKPSPRHLSPKDAAQVDPSNPAAMSSAEGAVISLPTDEKNAVDKIQSAVEDFSNFLQNTLAQFDAGLDFVKEWIDNEIVQRVEKVVAAATGLVGGMINSLFEGLIPILQQGLEMLYQSVSKLTLAATGNPAVAHLAGVAAQKAMGLPVKLLEDFIPCVVNSVLGKIEDLASTVLRSIADNVTNFVECVADQTVGVLVNGIIGFIDEAIKPLLSGIEKILQFIGGFSIEGLLREGVGALAGIIGLASCNKPAKSSDAPIKYMIGFGPVDGGTPNLNSIMESANVAAGMAQAGQQGFSLISGTISQLSNTGEAIGQCYAGPPTDCSPPTIDIFGGGGSGVEAKLIMGGLTQIGTAGIIGVEITNGGSGYSAPPFVQIKDNCGQGYGAVARATIKNGSVDNIYIVSEGENYPAGDIIPQVVTDVSVINPGSGYSDGDTVTDNLGNEYDVEIFNGSIIKVTPININDITDLPRLTILTSTGSGAKLYPTLGERPTGELQQVIDCVT